MMGSVPGIITVLVFVGLPFFINSAKDGFESVSPRLENISRSLGASMGSTFFRITFPLAWRSILIGFVMACARAVSEFGAVVVVAYHPMIAPVMIYERYEAYGLTYSQPLAFWLVLFCLVLVSYNTNTYFEEEKTLVIKVDNLKVAFEDFVLRDIHLEIRKNEFFVLMGPHRSR